MTDAWNQYPSNAVHGMIAVLEAKLKEQGFRIGSFDYKPDKDGNLKIVKIDKVPKHVKQARKAKAQRAVKAWKKGQHK